MKPARSRAGRTPRSGTCAGRGSSAGTGRCASGAGRRPRRTRRRTPRAQRWSSGRPSLPAAVSDVATLVAGDVLAEVQADGAESGLDVRLVGGLEFAGVEDADAQPVAGAHHHVGLIGLAVVDDDRLGVDDRTGGGLGQAGVEVEHPLVGDAQHGEPQGVRPVRAHRLRGDRVGQQPADVDALGSGGCQAPGQHAAGGDVEGVGEFDADVVVGGRVVGEHVQRGGVHQ